MSTIANLLSLIDPGAIKPFGEAYEGIERGRRENETGLLELARAKQAQATEARAIEAIQNDPELRRRLFGDGSILGSIGPAGGQGGPPAPGPMTQQQVMPGQAPGAPQTVPGGQDLSQFATQGAPLQSTIGSLGPAGQPQMQAPRNPVLEMAQRDPRAAMMLQQQMQGQQDRQWKQQEQQWKMQEQQLSNGVKIAEYVSRMLQGVTDQDSLDTAREQIRQVHPQAASQVPQMYSKAGIASVQQRGASITEMAQNRYHEAKARNLDMETQMFPELAKRFGLGDEAQTTGEGGATTTTARPSAPGSVPGVDKLSPTFRAKADTIADRLGANRDDFYRVMHFETGGEMSPATTNRAGSGATGLIQFTPATAKGLGTTTEALAKMTPEQQLDYVEKYLEPYKGKIGNLKDLYMAVLYPAALGKSEDTVLFSPDKTPGAYRQNAGLDAGNKGYVTVGDAVAAVERTTGGGTRATGGTTGTAQTSASDPRIAQLETKIAQRTRDAQIASLMKNESLSTRLNDEATRLTAEKNRLIDQSRHQQERAEAIPRKVEEQAALEPGELRKQRAAAEVSLQAKMNEQAALEQGELRKQRAAAEVSLEAKMNEPIGAENAVNMGLPPQTRWKDVPKDVKITKQLGDTTAKQFSEFKASHAGLSRVLTMLENPKAHSIIGTLFSGDNAAFRRRAGEWISSVTPQERKFVASLVAEIADIRHTLSGAAVSPTESEFLQPMMPSAADPDVGTVRAKLEALQEWMTRKHDAYRDQFEQSGYRVPAALARTEEKAPPAGSGNVDKFKAIKP